MKTFFHKPQSLKRGILLGALFLSSVLSINPVAAQESAYPLQMSTSRTILRPEVPGPNGLVTAGHPLAASTGLQILMQGGNAADAAVAVLATLNVVRPQMSGAGGNGFATYLDAASGEVYSLNATGAAAMSLDAASLSPQQLNKGIHAGVVPGLFGGWITLLQRFGTMSLGQVLAPALFYAGQGHPLEASVSQAIANDEDLFRQFPTSAELLLPDDRVPQPGEQFYMQDLATTFSRLIEAEQLALDAGADRFDALQAAYVRFYEGDIASEMADFYQQQGGDFTREDFAAYSPQWTEPVHFTYRGYDIYTSPPSSRGGLEVAMQMKLVEGFDLAGLGPDDPLTTHLMAEAIKLAKADIYFYVADPGMAEMPLAGMLSDDYLAQRRALIAMDTAMQYPAAGQPPGFELSTAFELSHQNLAAVEPSRETSYEGSTTSFSIRDRAGNVIAMTPTHGGSFGTGVVVGRTGLTFNNGTRIGSSAPYPNHVNFARGGQVPILNNSPIIVLKEGEFVMALGTPGGETIGQTQFQVLVNVLDFGMGIQEAIEAPRFSLFATPGFYIEGAGITLRIEDRISVEQFEALQQMNHEVVLAPSYSLGSNQAILRHPAHGTVTAGADPRRAAYAAGW